MTSKIPGLAYGILLGGFFFLAVTACNNGGGDKKETTSDSSTTKPAEKMAPATIDTTHMDSASTRPVKTPD